MCFVTDGLLQDLNPETDTCKFIVAKSNEKKIN